MSCNLDWPACRPQPALSHLWIYIHSCQLLKKKIKIFSATNTCSSCKPGRWRSLLNIVINIDLGTSLQMAGLTKRVSQKWLQAISARPSTYFHDQLAGFYQIRIFSTDTDRRTQKLKYILTTYYTYWLAAMNICFSSLYHRFVVFLTHSSPWFQ